MPPEVLVLIFGSLFGIGGSILLGYRMHYRHVERLNSGGSEEDVGELREAVADLQEEVHALQKNAAGPLRGILGAQSTGVPCYPLNVGEVLGIASEQP